MTEPSKATYPGQIVLADGTQLPVELTVTNDGVRIDSGSAEIGSWALDECEIRSSGSGRYVFSADGDQLDFSPRDPDRFSHAAQMLEIGDVAALFNGSYQPDDPPAMVEVDTGVAAGSIEIEAELDQSAPAVDAIEDDQAVIEVDPGPDEIVIPVESAIEAPEIDTPSFEGQGDVEPATADREVAADAQVATPVPDTSTGGDLPADDAPGAVLDDDFGDADSDDDGSDEDEGEFEEIDRPRVSLTARLRELGYAGGGSADETPDVDEPIESPAPVVEAEPEPEVAAEALLPVVETDPEPEVVAEASLPVVEVEPEPEVAAEASLPVPESESAPEDDEPAPFPVISFEDAEDATVPHAQEQAEVSGSEGDVPGSEERGPLSAAILDREVAEEPPAEPEPPVPRFGQRRGLRRQPSVPVAQPSPEKSEEGLDLQGLSETLRGGGPVPTEKLAEALEDLVDRSAVAAHDEDPESFTVADSILESQRSLRASTKVSSNLPQMLKKAALVVGSILLIGGLGVGAWAVITLLASRPTTTEVTPTVVVTSAPATTTPPTTLPATTVVTEPPVVATGFTIPAPDFVRTWNETAQKVNPGLEIPTLFPPGDFESAITDYISLIGSVEADGTLGTLTMTIDPSGPPEADQMGLQALGLMLATIDPATTGTERKAILAAMGLNVDRPELGGLDGSVEYQGVSYRLVYQSDLLQLSATPAP